MQHSVLEMPQNHPPYRCISKEMSYAKEFSICCLATDHRLYNKLLDALAIQGFTQANSEFLVADNTSGDAFSAYDAIRIFTRQAVGKYILILHQDVLPRESADRLLLQIQQLEDADPTWGVIGNAGKESDDSLHGFLSLETHQGKYSLGCPFVKVQVIDENVIIVKNGLGITVSADLEGFHFYGFDICSIAMRLGFSVYVIDFMWSHDSAGTISESFINARNAVEEKMRKYHPSLRSSTTCTFLYWGKSRFQSLMTMCRAVFMLDISPVHDRGTCLMIADSRGKAWYFPLVYYPYFLIRRYFGYVMWWIRYPFSVPYKIGSWHFQWWKNNWRSRLKR